jgi:hypothetical protein
VPWITTAEVIAAGAVTPASANDQTWLEMATDTANAWAPAQRKAAGYTDDPDVAPSPDVATATALYALSVYRQRGSYGGAPSFEGLGAIEPPAPMFTMIRGLLGIPRAVVDVWDWDAPPVVTP